MKSKKYLMIIALVVAMLLLGANSSHAALQSNGNTPATDYLGNWMIKIRRMESLGGTLGLTETVSTTTLLPTTDSNNVDIHLEKNTEYGAIAILSASSYGNQSKVTYGGTTTGNKTGIILLKPADKTGNTYGEVVAVNNGQGYKYGSTVINNVNSKYVDMYTTVLENSVKVGDATIQTKGWHESKYYYWNNLANYALRRGVDNNIFSYYYVGESNGSSNTNEFARAIMICGEGI